MFSEEHFLDPRTPCALYSYCPFDDLLPEPESIDVDGFDVGCCVDNVVNSYDRTHFHPDDFVLVLHNDAMLRAKVRLPVEWSWSDAWVVVHMTSIDYRRADVTVKWVYSSKELLKLESRGQLDTSVGNIEFSPWARVLSDHVNVICSSTITMSTPGVHEVVDVRSYVLLDTYIQAKQTSHARPPSIFKRTSRKLRLFWLVFVPDLSRAFLVTLSTLSWIVRHSSVIGVERLLTDSGTLNLFLPRHKSGWLDYRFDISADVGVPIISPLLFTGLFRFLTAEGNESHVSDEVKICAVRGKFRPSGVQLDSAESTLDSRNAGEVNNSCAKHQQKSDGSHHSDHRLPSPSWRSSRQREQQGRTARDSSEEHGSYCTRRLDVKDKSDDLLKLSSERARKLYISPPPTVKKPAVPDAPRGRLPRKASGISSHGRAHSSQNHHDFYAMMTSDDEPSVRVKRAKKPVRDSGVFRISSESDLPSRISPRKLE
ncbi:hypothetical protein PENSPDRAFT_671967, partial [Peniophora sp. CONT]